MKKLLLAMIVTLGLTACTDAERSALGTYGNTSLVQCYSGGEMIFEDTSTGALLITSAGVGFRCTTTGRYINTYADCIVTDLGEAQ